MNTPFTYLIGWAKYNLWYYGVRYAKKCHPDDLWTTYWTSSKEVAKTRLLHGEPDVIQIRKVFNNVNAARHWEQKVLVRMRVIRKKEWLNRHDTISFDPTLCLRGEQHWTHKCNAETRNTWLKNFHVNQQNHTMPKGEEHWVHKNIKAGQKHMSRMNGINNPNNFPENKRIKSLRMSGNLNPACRPEVAAKISAGRLGHGKKHKRTECEFCYRDLPVGMYKRYHGINCKLATGTA